MRILAPVLFAAILLLGTISYAGAGPNPGCMTGRARAFIAISADPPYLVGDIPNHFTFDQRYFSRRYNCKGQSAAVRRVDLGLYDVRFPGISSHAIQATALSDEGVTASAYPEDGFIRVALRGPLSGNNVAARRDVAFSIAVF